MRAGSVKNPNGGAAPFLSARRELPEMEVDARKVGCNGGR